MITKVNENNFKEEVLDSTEIVVVKLFTTNCSNCIKIAPIFEKMADKYFEKYKFCEWQVVSSSEILSKYRVLAVPTFLFFRNGKLINRRVGVLSEKRILKYLYKISKLKKGEVKNNELTGLIDWSFLRFWE